MKKITPVKNISFIIAIALSLFCKNVVAQSADDLTLRYNKDAGATFTDALPIGNGRLGGMVYGVVGKEVIGLNESTVWSGNPGNNNKASAVNSLANARSQIFAQNFAAADATIGNNMIGGGQERFQPVGNLYLTFPGHTATNYYRELNLKTAIAKTTYTYNGVNYTREYFASFPDQVIVVRLTANQTGKITFTTTMDSPQTPVSTSSTGGNTLILNGQADAIKFQNRVKVVNEGGTITTSNNSVTVTGANSVTVYLAIGTNFNTYNNVTGDQAARATQDITNLGTKTYAQVLTTHLADYQKLFNRVDLNLGAGGTYSTQYTNQRVASFASNNDPQLVRLHYQFGRYLMISCSRPGSQPANLQGVWNNEMNPSWGSKYTTNINFQMNYWMTESANLSECFTPFAEKIKAMVTPGQQTALAHWGVNTGWVLHHNTDLWNRTAPIDGAWGLWPTGGAWSCYNLWEHYQFSKDKTYLSDVYPTMKGSAQFFLNSMVTETVSGNNYLVTCPSASPEIQHNGYWTCFAPTMDNQIIRDLFNATIKASEILNTDATLRDQLKAALAKIPPHKVGKYGQLQEWFYDWDSPNDKNRHISHLYGLFPSNQIGVRTTPTLYNAAKVTLAQRGDDATGWSLAWKINFWARMEDGNHAYKLIQLLLTPAKTYNNLFDAHPPFQIDGNFGAVSGINEMLIQSQNNEVQFLPALPTAWPKGSISGIKARGGFEVDTLVWSAGKLSLASVTSFEGGTLNLRYGALTKSYQTVAGGTYVFDNALNLITSGVGSTPYNNTPHAIPGIIQMEEFDEGPNGIAYYDASPGSSTGSSFRAGTDVDIETCTDTGVGYNLGYTTAGEWLNYTVNVKETGNYDLDLRVACSGDNKTLSVKIGNKIIANDVAIPNTGGWQIWQTVTIKDVPLIEGEQMMKVTIGAQDFVNINYVTFKTAIAPIPPTVSITTPNTNSIYTTKESVIITANASDSDGSIIRVAFYDDTTLLSTDINAPYSYNWSGMSAGAHRITAVATDNAGIKTTSKAVIVKIEIPQDPYNLIVHKIPGRIEAEEYDLGGEGQAYHDGSAGNTGGATFRIDEDVDIENCTDVSGVYNIGFATAGEWLEYTVNVTNAGLYDIDFRTACSGDGKTITLSMDGKAIGSMVSVPNSSGWQTWVTVSIKGVQLKEGQQVLRLTIGSSDYVNLNYMEFKESTTTSLNNEFISTSIEVYPNPFSNQVHVELKDHFSYQLISITGQVVEEGQADGKIDIGAKLPKGVYMLKLTQNGKSEFFKLIKE